MFNMIVQVITVSYAYTLRFGLSKELISSSLTIPCLLTHQVSCKEQSRDYPASNRESRIKARRVIGSTRLIVAVAPRYWLKRLELKAVILCLAEPIARPRIPHVTFTPYSSNGGGKPISTFSGKIEHDIPPQRFRHLDQRSPAGPSHTASFQHYTQTVKLDSRDTPPPLHFSPAVSDRERSSTAETTPIGTPRGFSSGFPRRTEKEKDTLFSWQHRHGGFASNTSSYVDSTLLESDLEDPTFPLFDDHSGHLDMGSRTTPIDIAASSRHGSPRSAHTSNLTSALQTTSGNEIRPTTAMDMSGQPKGLGAGFGDAASGSGFGSGAQPISVNASNREKPRRESLAGSMVTGMSWGGNSVGSWIRDDIIMQGTSPFAYQSPSFHSSSYLPKLEANFMRDFSCCNVTLPTLHELLQHYEEHHTEQMPSLQKQNSNQNNAPPDSKAALAAAAATGIQGQGRVQPPLQNRDASKQGQITPQRSSTPVTPRQSQPAAQYNRGFLSRPSTASQDEETVGDMEMDDDDFGMSNADMQPAQYPTQHRPRITQPSQFGQPASSRVTPLDMSALNLGNPLQQHQGLRNSQPTTPVSAGRNGMYHNNPTVSSVNTPTLTTYNNSTHPLQQQQFYTPDSSAPGTPGELDGDYVGNLGTMSMSNLQYMQGQNYGGFGYGNGNDMLNLCVDEPAKTLWSVNGGFNNPQQPQQQQSSQPTSASQLGDGQYSENSELARTIREQQKLAGVPDPSADGVPKPFHCPVIGCEKAYKNQNGLKYHKAHGHNTQKLHANDNGTYSIVDPDTLTPYPGTVGMEKHKPYRCDNCGKRYKNLNGLKYHKNHSPNCDSEIQNPFPSASQQKSDQRAQLNPSHADDMAL